MMKRLPYGIYFSALLDKEISTENIDTPFPLLPPPLLSIIFFDTRIFVKHRMAPLRWFLVLWDNTFSIKNCDIPLLGKKFFDTRFFSGTQKGSSTKWFGTVRPKNIDRKSCFPSPSYAWNFWIIKLFSYTEGFPFNVFRYSEKKNFRKKFVISPSYLWNFTISFFWNTEELPHDVFRYCEITIFL